jgi:2-polyprenyl-6-methoxyphenol hydroxylase-like FAD-dependent oxidoreductase
LLDRLKWRRVAHVERFDFYRIGGDRLCQVDYRILAHPFPYALIALADQSRRVLLHSLGAYPNVQIHWDTQFTEVLWVGRKVIGVRALERGYERDFFACVTVGSDGADSPFRGALGISYRITLYTNGFLGMLVRRPNGFPREVRYHLGRGEILSCFPCSPDQLYLLYMLPVSSLRTMDQQGLASVRARIVAIEPDLRSAWRDLTAETQVSAFMPRQVRTKAWVTDGAALIGDAAHACHPHVAQGSLQAVEDAKVLAVVLESCFARGDFSVHALALYEQTRRPVVERVQRVADEYVWLWETDGPLLAWIRDRIFANVGESPKLLCRLAATEAGIEPRPLSFLGRLQALGVGI